MPIDAKRFEEVRIAINHFSVRVRIDNILLVALMNWYKEHAFTQSPYRFFLKNKWYKATIVNGYIEVWDISGMTSACSGRVDVLVKRILDYMPNLDNVSWLRKIGEEQGIAYREAIKKRMEKKE